MFETCSILFHLESFHESENIWVIGLEAGLKISVECLTSICGFDVSAQDVGPHDRRVRAVLM